MRSQLLYFNSLSVPLKIVPLATLGTRAIGLPTPVVEDSDLNMKMKLRFEVFFYRKGRLI
jgi:hypothetical protein